LPPPTLEPHRIDVVDPDIKIDPVLDKADVQDVTAYPVVDRVPQIPNPGPPIRAVNRVSGGPGKAFPNTDDYYPPAEIRMGRTGISTVQVCTDEKGRLTAAPTLAQSSGSPGLDEGALRLAKAGSGHYRASTEDGRAVSSCYPFRVRFDIKK
jgi:TonB family protein